MWYLYCNDPHPPSDDKEKRDKMIGFINDYRIRVLERSDNAETLAAVHVAEGIISEAYETDACFARLGVIPKYAYFSGQGKLKPCQLTDRRL
jgi:hypothetical protein